MQDKKAKDIVILNVKKLSISQRGNLLYFNIDEKFKILTPL